MLQYQHGFAADNLVSARVVLHDGRAVTASPASNPDLWWALRGAGHNFGVVASFETRAYDFVPDDDGEEETWRVDGLVFTQDKLEGVLGAWNELEAEFPDPGHLVLHGIVRLVDEIDPDHVSDSIQPSPPFFFPFKLHNDPYCTSFAYSLSFSLSFSPPPPSLPHILS